MKRTFHRGKSRFTNTPLILRKTNSDAPQDHKEEHARQLPPYDKYKLTPLWPSVPKLCFSILDRQSACRERCLNCPTEHGFLAFTLDALPL